MGYFNSWGGEHMYSVLGGIASQGRMAVQFFFVISAYLGFISFSKFIQSKSNSSYINTSLFWVLRKYLSLLPVYLFALLAFSLWYGFNYRSGFACGEIKILDYILHIFMLHGFVPFTANSIIGVEWYIGVLFIYYLSLPLIFKIIKNIDSALWFLILSCFFAFVVNNVVYKFYPQFEYSGYFSNNSFIIQLPVLSFGIVLYFMKKDTFAVDKKNFFPSILVLCYMLLGLMYDYKGYFEVSRVVLIGLFACLILYLLSNYKFHFIDNNFFSLFGKYSYTIYLFHYLILYVLWKNFSFNVYQNIIFSAFISLIIAIGIQTLLNSIYTPLIKRIN